MLGTPASPAAPRGLVRPPRLHRPDKKLIIALGLLLIFGLVMLFSASLVAAYLKSGNSLYFLNHQLQLDLDLEYYLVQIENQQPIVFSMLQYNL